MKRYRGVEVVAFAGHLWWVKAVNFAPTPEVLTLRRTTRPFVECEVAADKVEFSDELPDSAPCLFHRRRVA